MLARKGKFVGTKATDLEGRQGYCWQWRRVVVESVGSGDGAFELNVSTKVVRCELYIAVLDIVYDTFGQVDDALGCVRARMIEPSHSQRSSDEIDVPLDRAVFALHIESHRRSDRLLQDDSCEGLFGECDSHFRATDGELPERWIRGQNRCIKPLFVEARTCIPIGRRR